MTKVSVTLNGRAFSIGCEEGQEPYLRDLAAYLDGKVSELAGQVGQIGDLRLLLMAALIVVDELKESGKRIESLESHVDRLRQEGQGATAEISAERAALVERVVQAAERLERLVESAGQTVQGEEDEAATA